MLLHTISMHFLHPYEDLRSQGLVALSAYDTHQSTSDVPFEYIGAIQQENKILKKEVADFKSGERFKQIQSEHQKLVDEYRRQIKQLNLVIKGLRKDVKNA